MTVHPVRMSGTVIAAPETYRYFERLQERIIQFVAANSRVTAERFRELMLMYLPRELPKTSRRLPERGFRACSCSTGSSAARGRASNPRSRR